MLKAIGFLKKHSRNYSCTNEEYSFANKGKEGDLLVPNICQYLESGKIVIAFLHCHHDGAEIIAPAILYTDGIWVWPSYYAYYIKKQPDLYIPPEFIAHVTANNFAVPEIENERMQYVEYIVITKLMNDKTGKNIKLPSSLLKMIETSGSEIVCY